MLGFRDYIATKLNSFENHRTQIEYEDSMIFKQFVFQFINYYFLFAYISFLKVGAPFAPFSEYLIINLMRIVTRFLKLL